MTEIYFVRHGETDWNNLELCQGLTDIPLSEKGKNQAKQLGEILLKDHMQFDTYISSPLTRAIQTLEIIKKVLNDKKEIVINNDFIERNFGILEGKSFKKVTEVLESNTMQEEIKGFETNDTLSKRIYLGTLKLEKEYPNQKILLVTHSNTIKGLMYYLTHGEFKFANPIPNLNVSKFTVNNQKIELNNLYLYTGLGTDKTCFKNF